jgi:hypothetical protein
MRLKRARTLLCVIDVQGRLAEKAFRSDYKRLEILIAGCQQLDVPVLWFEQVPDKLGATVPSVAACLEAAKAAKYVKKSFSALGAPQAAEVASDRHIAVAPDTDRALRCAGVAC